MTTFQIILFSAAGFFLIWPLLSGFFAKFRKPVDSPLQFDIGLLVALRKEFADDPEAMKAIDEIIMPAVIRIL